MKAFKPLFFTCPVDYLLRNGNDKQIVTRG